MKYLKLIREQSFYNSLVFIVRLCLIVVLLEMSSTGHDDARAQPNDELYKLVVRVTACGDDLRIGHCEPAEFGSGILIDGSGIVLTAFHLARGDAPAPNAFRENFEVAFTSDAPSCGQTNRICRARLLAAVPKYDLALLQIQFEEPTIQENFQQLVDSIPLTYLDRAVDSQDEIRVLGYRAQGSPFDQIYDIERINADVASITIDEKMAKGLSGGPMIIERDGRSVLAGIVSRLDRVNPEKTIIQTLNKIPGFYWYDGEEFGLRPQPFPAIDVSQSEKQTGSRIVDVINVSTLLAATPQTVGTLLLYLFDEQQVPITVPQDGQLPTAFDSQLVWTQRIESFNLVKPVNMEIDLSIVFELLEIDSAFARLVMVDRGNRYLWSHEEWLSIGAPSPIPTPTPVGPVGPVETSTLDGRIAFTRLRHDDVWITKIICLETSLPCPQLEHVRQPDFDSAGRLLVNGSGNGKDDIIRMDSMFGQVKMISRHPEDSRPHWSPDGEQIVYDSTFFGDRYSRIYVQTSLGRPENSPPSLKYAGIDFIGSYPIFLSDGRVAFQGCDRWREGGRQCGIMISEIPPFSVPNRITDSTEDLPTDRMKVGQQDKILFMSKRSGNWDVYSVNVNGTEIANLTNSPTEDGLATASPDNQHIAFYSNRDGFWGIYVARSDGSGVSLLEKIEETDKKAWKEERLSWGP